MGGELPRTVLSKPSLWGKTGTETHGVSNEFPCGKHHAQRWMRACRQSAQHGAALCFAQFLISRLRLRMFSHRENSARRFASRTAHPLHRGAERPALSLPPLCKGRWCEAPEGLLQRHETTPQACSTPAPLAQGSRTPPFRFPAAAAFRKFLLTCRCVCATMELSIYSLFAKPQRRNPHDAYI